MLLTKSNQMTIRTDLFQVSFTADNMGIVIADALRDFELYHHKVEHHVYKAHEMIGNDNYKPELPMYTKVQYFLDYFFMFIRKDNFDIIATRHKVTEVGDTFVVSFFITYKPNEYVQG
jgi:hypothetical protein